jgi:23S rRNA (guanosine2251-2'-O)-methyltransferase
LIEGAIVRSSAAFDVSAVVVGERRSVGVNAAVWKAAAGALAQVGVVQVINISRTITELKNLGFFVIGLSAEGSNPLPELDKELTERSIAIVVGSEGKGISRLVGEACDLHVAIPITSKAESLNASVAASIVLYQIAVNRNI